MIRLFGAETSRLLSRRFTLITMIVVLLGLCAFQLVVNQQLQPPTAAEQAAVQQSYEEAHRFWETNERTCAEAGNPPDCRYEEPKVSEYTFAEPFEDVVAASLQVAIYLVALTALMVAGSFIGAEYTTGSLANWLSFIPRRGQVFASKLVIVVAFSAMASAAGAALMLGGALFLAGLHDIPVTKMADQVSMLGRGVLVAVALAVVGFCLGLVGRHTAAAIGVLLGYLFVWFVRNAILSEAEWAQRLTPWTPEGNLAAIVNRGHQYYLPVRTVGPEGVGVDYVERTVSLTHGLIFWAAVLAVIIAGSALIFRRRDVT